MSRPSGSKSRVILIFLAFAAVAVFYFAQTAKQAKSPSSDWKKGEVTINNQNFSVYLAETPLEHEVGLSIVDRINSNEGMLFIFDSPQKPGFWMKDMKFSIDILWINNNSVAGITENIPVDTGRTLTKYYPEVEVDKVLELNAGTCDKFNIKAGDHVEIR